MVNLGLGRLHSGLKPHQASPRCLCVSEESKAVQEATDSVQQLSVETDSEAAPSDSAAETSNPTPTPAADN